ncbi:sterile alpha motif domain-containing protein 9-like [Alosa alosa]|uniref:sterile alpha motif domain-containing protein 9-like n=1 Tax=Alosa alosa TaxID=278164 RepID=UPI0020151F70|nr:sterile alpha motif domain-containing protein 9-like [Alosa alosa]
MSRRTLPPSMEDWTREDVHHWLCQEVNVYKKYADILLEEEVAGIDLLSFKKQDLLDLGLKHGPAVRIIDMRDKWKNQPQHTTQSCSVGHNNKSDIEAASFCSKGHVNVLEANDKSCAANNKPDESQAKDDVIPKTHLITSSIEHQEEDSSDLQPQQCSVITQTACDHKESTVESLIQKKNAKVSSKPLAAQREETKRSDPEQAQQSHEKKTRHIKNLCDFYPFDTVASHRYIQHNILPPETGPGNLITPVHEFKFMGRTTDINILKRKFNQEVYRFAAGCMNSRTNGTIHIGIADSKYTDFCHGEIIGIKIEQWDAIIDHFNNGLNSYFDENSEDAKKCIRQPRFVQVIYSNMTCSDLYVIEVDIVPSHNITCDKTYYIQTLESNNNWKKSKEKSLFVREGAATKDICSSNPEVFRRGLEAFKRSMTMLDSKREQMEKRPEPKATTNQGNILQNLLTCGETTLGHYEHFIIVTNKSYQEQLQHLQFLNLLKIFCVLDFDPDSASNGLCSEYRKSRVANLYTPEQFQGEAGTVIKTLNLYKQTSWVFCNGRLDLDIESNKPLNPKEWLAKRANDVNEVIRFICNPDILPLEKKPSGVSLVLHS